MLFIGGFYVGEIVYICGMDTQDISKCTELYAALSEMALNSHSTRPGETARFMFVELTGITPVRMNDRRYTISEDTRARLDVAWKKLCGPEDDGTDGGSITKLLKRIAEEIRDASERIVPRRGCWLPPPG